MKTEDDERSTVFPNVLAPSSLESEEAAAFDARLYQRLRRRRVYRSVVTFGVLCLLALGVGQWGGSDRAVPEQATSEADWLAQLNEIWTTEEDALAVSFDDESEDRWSIDQRDSSEYVAIADFVGLEDEREFTP